MQEAIDVESEFLVWFLLLGFYCVLFTVSRFAALRIFGFFSGSDGQVSKFDRAFLARDC